MPPHSGDNGDGTDAGQDAVTLLSLQPNLPACPAVLALVNDDQLVAGTARAAGRWWTTPASTDPDTRIGLAWSLARIPGVTATLAHTTPPTIAAIHRAEHLAATRRQSIVLPGAPIFTIGAVPAPPAGMIRLPHPAGRGVLWELVAEAGTERLIGHPVPDAGTRHDVEVRLDLVVELCAAVAGGHLPPSARRDPVLSGWAERRLDLTLGLIYRHWMRIRPTLAREHLVAPRRSVTLRRNSERQRVPLRLLQE
ncbi:hypothetical protein Lfu02_15530 [Longispora fulva]|uniref:Uncharacterized protein n=1 Tax=Longispora fulva TaxID=619741 RepID=A0A8J7GNK8_9ACTN|nr:hypothetical protein [Longispora fulva]GIG57181.1 hypothetical protein Lfu02_15530 [Longispora fulva]